MKKTAYTLLSVLLIGMLFAFGACSDDDDDDYEVTDGWKNYQLSVRQKAQELVDKETGAKVYKSLESRSGLGYIYYRSSDYITKRMAGDFSEKEPTVFSSLTKTTGKTKPEYDTDFVDFRYEAWYYNEDGERVLFDTTEQMNNNKVITRALNNVAAGYAITDGLKTLIMDMEVGEERIGCVRHELGYGTYGASIYTATGQTTTVYGYTTIFYDVKLLGVRSK